MATASPDTASVVPTVYVIDDDEGLRLALDRLFRSVGYQTRVFANTSEFLLAGVAKTAGCLVLDIRLPGSSGLDFQDQLTSAGVAMPVILMTGHGDIPMTVRGMKAGAVDFLPKPFREQDMLDAVSAALTRDTVRRAERSQIEDIKARFEGLTSRELEIMNRVATGKMNKQIAFDLDLAEITVKIHRSNAMKKLGAKTLADFVSMAQALKHAG
jgi:FixJ family two-component response regulator